MSKNKNKSQSSTGQSAALTDHITSSSRWSLRNFIWFIVLMVAVLAAVVSFALRPFHREQIRLNPSSRHVMATVTDNQRDCVKDPCGYNVFATYVINGRTERNVQIVSARDDSAPMQGNVPVIVNPAQPRTAVTVDGKIDIVQIILYAIFILGIIGFTIVISYRSYFRRDRI